MSVTVFQGAEQPTVEKQLVSLGVQRLGYVWAGMQKRKLHLWPPECEIHVLPGEPPKGADRDEWFGAYIAFCEGRDGQLASWMVPAERNFSGEHGAPLWTPDLGGALLGELAAEHGTIYIPRYALTADLPPLPPGIRVRVLGYHSDPGSVCGNVVACHTRAWQSPAQYGETQFWDGTALHRARTGDREQLLLSLGTAMGAAGFDVELIRANDRKELSRMAVWSHLQKDSRQSAARSVSRVSGGDSKPARQPPVERPHAAATPLPTVGFETRQAITPNGDGSSTISERTYAVHPSTSVRSCDTCVVTASCPASSPGAACSFGFPIEVRTKEQLSAFLTTIIEMQGTRVAFARYAEELGGGYPMPQVSREIDRLFNIVARMRKMEQDSASLKVSVEGYGASGMLSAIFGQGAPTPPAHNTIMAEPEPPPTQGPGVY